MSAKDADLQLGSVVARRGRLQRAHRARPVLRRNAGRAVRRDPLGRLRAGDARATRAAAGARRLVPACARPRSGGALRIGQGAGRSVRSSRGTSLPEPVRPSLGSLPDDTGPAHALQPGTLLGATITHSGAPKGHKWAVLAAVAGTLGALVIAGALLVTSARKATGGFASAPPPAPSARIEVSPVSPPVRSAPVPLASAAPAPVASTSAASKPARQPARPRNTASPPTSASARKPAAFTPSKDKDYGFRSEALVRGRDFRAGALGVPSGSPARSRQRIAKLRAR